MEKVSVPRRPVLEKVENRMILADGSAKLFRGKGTFGNILWKNGDCELTAFTDHLVASHGRCKNMISFDDKNLHTLSEKAWRKLEAELKDVAREKKKGKKKYINRSKQC